jgi:serine/threonine-protein kinase
MPDDATIEQPPPADAPTLTRVGSDGTPREAPTGFAPPGYEVLSELGRGGMGVVYKARQKSLNRLVALKVILGAGHAGADQLTRFRAEATTAAQLQHPNIVQVFEVGEHAGQPFFSLELVEGGSLADRLKGEPQPPREAAELVRTLALAVQHAHSKGVVHRDLKPSNILLENDQSPMTNDQTKTGWSLVTGHWSFRTKITDFGLAKQQSTDTRLTASGAILGTPSYMAPEQAAGDGSAVGPAVDVYALGAILYELLTGRPPFKAASVMDTVLQVLHEDPVPPSRLQPKLPRDLETICLKCLAKKPDQRYASAAALADDLGRFLGGESILARPASPVGRALKWARRHPARAVVLFVLAVPLPLALASMVFLWAHATAAKKDAEQQKANADRERELAQGYLHNALGTMDRILDRVGDERLARIPAVQEERNAILGDALAFFESLLRIDSTDPRVREQTAQTYARVARTSLAAGRTDQSARAAQGGVDLFEALAAQYPDRPQYRDDLAEAYIFLGHSRVLNADFAGGLEAYQKGAEIAGALAREFPGEPAYRATAAECHRSLGYYFTVANSREGEAHFKEAVRLAEDLHREHPQSAEYRALLASILGAYGQFLVAHQRLPEARPLVERGMALTTGPGPRSGRARMNQEQGIITLRTSAARLHEREGKREKSRELLEQATKRYEELIAGQPQSFPYRLQAVQAYGDLARVQRAENDPAGALKATGRAVDLYDEMLKDFPVFQEMPRSAWFQQQRAGARINHAINLASDGKVSEAATLAAAAEKGPPVPSAVQAYNLACVFAQLVGKAEGGTKDDYAAKAMTWLKRAQATGYPATASAIDHVRTKDEDLNSLRERPEFQEWVKGLKPAKK